MRSGAAGLLAKPAVFYRLHTESAAACVVMHRLPGLHLDVDVDTCGHLQSLESVDSLLCGGDDVDQALVCALFELLTRIFLFMNGAEDGNYLFLSRERNGAADL